MAALGVASEMATRIAPAPRVAPLRAAGSRAARGCGGGGGGGGGSSSGSITNHGPSSRPRNTSPTAGSERSTPRRRMPPGRPERRSRRPDRHRDRSTIRSSPAQSMAPAPTSSAAAQRRSATSTAMAPRSAASLPRAATARWRTARRSMLVSWWCADAPGSCPGACAFDQRVARDRLRGRPWR